MVFFPKNCFAHLAVLFSFSGVVAVLVSAEMLAGALVLCIILTALPGKIRTQEYSRNYNSFFIVRVT